MATVTEIAPDIFRICTYIGDLEMQFNQFLVRDREPLLYHTGMKAMFPVVREAVAKVIDPATLRWIAFSHFESDECGALNDFLAVAPDAVPLGSTIAATISLGDSADRTPRGLGDGEELSLGRRSVRWIDTPHLPHGWESGQIGRAHV